MTLPHYSIMTRRELHRFWFYRIGFPMAGYVVGRALPEILNRLL